MTDRLRRRTRRRSRRWVRKLQAELLEDRRMLTTLVVNTTADVDGDHDPLVDLIPGDGLCQTSEGNCSLRAAIEESNALVGVQEIVFRLPAGENHFYYQDNRAAGVTAGNRTPTMASQDSLIADIDRDHPHSWWTIQPQTHLPTITKPVTIDGYSQFVDLNKNGVRELDEPGATPNTGTSPGLDSVLRVELDGSRVGTTNSPEGVPDGEDYFVLRVTGGGSTIKGLAINGFASYQGVFPIDVNEIAGMKFQFGLGQAIVLSGGNGNHVEGNFIGTDISGKLALDGLFDPTTDQMPRPYGVNIFSSGNVIGVDTADATSDHKQKNLISALGWGVVTATDTENFVVGNLIGTDHLGINEIPNFIGVGVGGGVVSDNLISGNKIGVAVGTGLNSPTSGARIIRNVIGPTVSGDDGEIGNRLAGIAVLGNSTDNHIGGEDSSDGNHIAYNGGRDLPNRPEIGAGIWVTDLFGHVQGNAIQGNSIHDNIGLGIDLGGNPDPYPGTGEFPPNTNFMGPDGVSENDPGDSDTGPNNFQNSPQITIAQSGDVITRVWGEFEKQLSSEYTLDFYASSSADAATSFVVGGFGEGERWLGSLTLSTEETGELEFSPDDFETPLFASELGELITTTATSLIDGTSEFSAAVVVMGAPTIISPVSVMVPENQTAVIDVQSTDPEGETEGGGGLTYSLVGGEDQVLFSIDADSGLLTFITPPNFESPGDVGGDNVYNVKVAVTDTAGLTSTQDIAVTVTDANDAPTVINPIPELRVDQNSPVETLDLSSTFGDVDAGDNLTLTVMGNTDPSLVTPTIINGTELTLEFLLDQNGGTEITVRATDSGGLFVEETFTVFVLLTQFSDLKLNQNLTDVHLFEDAGELVVSGVVSGNDVEFFRQSLDTFTGLVIDGPPQSNNFVVDLDNLSPFQLPDGITINAGDKGNSGTDVDTLTINGSETVTNYQYTTGGPESGTIVMDGFLVTFAEFEPIIDNLNVINRTFSIGTPGGQLIWIANDGMTGNDRTIIDDGGTGAFESITFYSPTESLNINAGDGDDMIILTQLDVTFNAVLTINAEDGNDSVDAKTYDRPLKIFAGDGDDYVMGGTADDEIDGGNGSDRLDGGLGNDAVDGGLGDDDITVDAEDSITVAEGDLLRLVLPVHGAQEGDTGSIDWGDGTATDPFLVDEGTISASHVYTEESTELPGGVYNAVLSINGSTTNIEITVENTPPTLVISGDQTVSDGQAYTLNLSTYDPGSDTISSWSIDWGHGAPQLIAGNPSVVEHTFPPGLAAAYPISVTATDEDGTYESNMLLVFTGDLPPVAAVDGPGSGVRGQSREIVLTASDIPPDEATGFIFEVDYGDGSRQTVSPTAGNGSGMLVEHVYTEAGSYTISVTATDQSDQTSQLTTHSIEIKVAELQDDPHHAGQTALFVGGSTGRDDIELMLKPFDRKLHLKLNEKDNNVIVQEAFELGISRFVVFGQAGDDDVRVHNSVGDLPAELYGGAGDDKLTGGDGPDVLVGGDGDDFLIGTNGRDLMVGGEGADTIFGDNGEDILIGGSYVDQLNRRAVNAIMTEWTRTDLNYVDRVEHLNGTASDGMNGEYRLNASTVLDDNATDILKGKKGADYTLANPDDDKIDVELEEILTQLASDLISS